MSITIRNTNTSSETPIINGKDIQIQCPKTAEQKDTEAFDEQQTAAVSFTKTEQQPSSVDKTEQKDGDYDPKEETEPESEDVSSDEESEQQSENESASEEIDDEEIMYSNEFQQEFAEAIDNVLCLAKADGEKILEKVAQDYFDETGNEPTEQQIADAFETFAIGTNQEQYVSDIYEVELNQEEFAEALENVRELGKFHQEQFVDELCDKFVEFNGEEPTVEELENVFGKIKNNFADEAREEFIALNDAESDSDSDYEATTQDLNQIKKDNKYDRKAKTEIVFVNESDTESDSDSEYDSQEESEIESGSENSDVSDVSAEYSQEEVSDVSDDDNDDDYSPEKDAFDYSQDIKDEEEFETELNGTDENEVECQCDDQDTNDMQ